MQGEFEKRIDNLVTKKKYFTNDILQMLKEAKKEFPKSFLIRTEPFGKIESGEQYYTAKEIDEWLEKWFGE